MTAAGSVAPIMNEKNHPQETHMCTQTQKRAKKQAAQTYTKDRVPKKTQQDADKNEKKDTQAYAHTHTHTHTHTHMYIHIYISIFI